MPCRARAARQHAGLVAALEAEGVDVCLVPGDRTLPDLAFTRDTSLMTPWGLLGLAPGASHRRREVDVVMDSAKAAGLPILGRIDRGRIAAVGATAAMALTLSGCLVDDPNESSGGGGLGRL